MPCDGGRGSRHVQQHSALPPPRAPMPRFFEIADANRTSIPGGRAPVSTGGALYLGQRFIIALHVQADLPRQLRRRVRMRRLQPQSDRLPAPYEQRVRISGQLGGCCRFHLSEGVQPATGVGFHCDRIWWAVMGRMLREGEAWMPSGHARQGRHGTKEAKRWWAVMGRTIDQRM